MPSNILIFDADYISELTSAMTEACQLVDEAVANLKKASLHEGWKCKECARISENIDDLNLRLGRLDGGVNETVRVLGNSVSRFAELEAKYETQANNLSEELRENHGYSASVHESSAESAVGAGTAATAATAGAKTGNPAAKPDNHANGAASPTVNISGGRMPDFGRNTNTNINNNFNNVNLPVTHIPDRPDDIATGTKDTEQISDFAVTSVADTITQILGGNVSVKIIAPDGTDRTVEHLIEAYNTGKNIVEKSASVIANTSMPHTEERIAMATGIATLAGGAVTGVGILKAGSASVANIQDLGKQAENLLPSIQDNDELRSVLGAISVAGGASAAGANSSSKSKKSFWDEVLEGNEIVNNFVEKFGGASGSSGSGSSAAGARMRSGGDSVSLAGLNSSSGTSSSRNSDQNFVNKLMDSLISKFVGNSNSSGSSSSNYSPIETFLSSFVAD